MNKDNKLSCFTIGHSNHSTERFIELLQAYKIDCLVDVRSAPYSKFASQFNKDFLEVSLKNSKISYLFLGNRLGGRYTNPQLLFSDGVVNFSKVMDTRTFQDGIDEVINKIKNGTIISIMCSEKDPFDCHRFVLVSHGLALKGVEIKHILENGEIISNEALEDRLLKMYKKDYDQPSLFEPRKTREQALEEAYEMRNKDVAYALKEEKG